MEQSTSLPHTSQPVGDCRANSSIRGRSPASSTIFLPDNIGLFAVFRYGCKDHLMNICRVTLRRAFRCKQAKLYICACPVAHAPKQRRCLFVLLYPCESDRFIGEAPSINDRKCFAQSRECHPHKQDAVFICQFSDREISDVIHAHGRVVRFSGSPSALL